MLGYIFNRSLARREKKALAKLAYEADAKVPSTYSGTALPNYSFVREADIIAYDLTKGMLDYLNYARDYTGLCFNELPETELCINGSDMPTFGRRFEVYFNALPLGIIEFSAGHGLRKYCRRPERGNNSFNIKDLDNLLRLDYSFENLEILNVGTAKSLLRDLIVLMLPADDLAKSRTKATSIAVEIMMDYLWELQNNAIFNPAGRRAMSEVYGLIEGNAGIYLEETETQLNIMQQ